MFANDSGKYICQNCQWRIVIIMSKFNELWKHISSVNKQNLTLTFDEIEKIAGIPIDHSFLRYKKELNEYGYNVEKISMKEKNVYFAKQI